MAAPRLVWVGEARLLRRASTLFARRAVPVYGDNDTARANVGDVHWLEQA
ncbi:hypothetical protein [Aquamicrobium zhengzhouense]|uniref:Uncharacterized protein n=1 Tax=Aquamicrobium zhengzhouense TaxID=2781738 RepID=A0ABS0SHA0_9HYPH|nr:hypothetical protein [Aquamicrobium zhengzhouense]MBI1622656.1 hypothetical protein [Aquamicrobium zhengzhouense]